MSAIFPFNYAPATATYYLLYTLTLALHGVFVAYVLGGSAYLALSIIRGRDALDPLARTLREWLPFALGLAITAGVAPLLFLQLLFKHELYSANLLLSHRWMIMLPVLMAGFYLLYLFKTEKFPTLSPLARAAAALAAFAAFAFTGYSWSENHLVSQMRDRWPEMYASGRMFFGSAEATLRFAIALAGALPIMSVLLGWQLRASSTEAPRLARIALLGSFAAAAPAAAYSVFVDSAVIAKLTSWFALPHLIAVVLGFCVQLGAWFAILRRKTFSTSALITASLGSAAILIGDCALREVIRSTRVDVAALEATHARIAGAGGAVAFVIFLIINTTAIAWCIRAVARHLRSTDRGFDAATSQTAGEGHRGSSGGIAGGEKVS